LILNRVDKAAKNASKNPPKVDRGFRGVKSHDQESKEVLLHSIPPMGSKRLSEYTARC
jgi:hypothetical protein